MRLIFEYEDRQDRSHAKYLMINHVTRLDYYDDNRQSRVYLSDGTYVDLDYKYASKLRDLLKDLQR